MVRLRELWQPLPGLGLVDPFPEAGLDRFLLRWSKIRRRPPRPVKNEKMHGSVRFILTDQPVTLSEICQVA